MKLDGQTENELGPFPVFVVIRFTESNFRGVGIPLTQVAPTCCGDLAFDVDPGSVGEHL